MSKPFLIVLFVIALVIVMYNCNYYLVSFGFSDCRFFIHEISFPRRFSDVSVEHHEKFKFRSAYQRLVWEPENDNLHFRLTAQTDVDINSTSQRTSLD